MIEEVDPSQISVKFGIERGNIEVFFCNIKRVMTTF
jgi:hypothetical protein